MNTSIIQEKNELLKLCMVILFAFVLLLPVFPSASMAASQGANNADSQITKVLCNAVNQLTGTIGRSIAAIIIISLAIALFLGKVSWGLAIAVAVGMGILFGARDVVALLSGEAAPCAAGMSP